MDVLDENRKTYLKEKSQICDKYLFKLYSDNEEKLDKISRNEYAALFIDYNKQLSKGNIIYDSNGCHGLWAMPKNMVMETINNNSLKNYGKNLMILEPIKNGKYFIFKNEIVGMKYKVVECIKSVDQMDEYKERKLYDYINS